MKPVSVNTIQKYKNENKKITALTAYDYSTAKYIDEAGIDIILVGDSLAMVALGHENTLSITVDEMMIFTKAVTKAVKNSFVVVDMPFMSYQTDKKTAIENAGRFIKESGAKAVKLEGGSPYITDIVEHCVNIGIPVLAHLGFTPQFLNTIGGYNIQGKNAENTQKILTEALKLEKAGAFGLVLEMVPEECAKVITENLKIPTIGIGAGRYCSGQILVCDDILGKYSDFTPKFARKYADMASLIKNAANDYKNDVVEKNFPSENEVFFINKEEKEKLDKIKCK
ncbi:MAG: 3-methyl-2-oxobutanoate hydroxymethyltransferase [Candidatus Gastranaerophilales bacterium]|nr:3-methyl-2-oxobutanoate hydroxymethyltransferase [Candidatus Gastranaerophilales bacterium]